MATSSDSYGNTTGIERLIGDLWVSRAITTTTVPTLEQIETAIDDIGSELNVVLAGAGYVVPMSTSADPIPSRWLESINNQGAAAILLGTIPMTAIAPESEDAGSNRMQMYIGFYNRGLKRIEEEKIRASRTSGRISGLVKAGSATDSNGDIKKPIFFRGLDDTDKRKSKLTE